MEKRKQCSQVSMKNACKTIKGNTKGSREASRLDNIPVETLRRRVEGKVSLLCRPGLSTVLTDVHVEEARLADCCVMMEDKGLD